MWGPAGTKTITHFFAGTVPTAGRLNDRPYPPKAWSPKPKARQFVTEVVD